MILIPSKLILLRKGDKWRARLYLGGRKYSFKIMRSDTEGGALSEAYEWYEAYVSAPKSSLPSPAMRSIADMVLAYNDKIMGRRAGGEIGEHQVRRVVAHMKIMLRWYEASGSPSLDQLPKLFDQYYVHWRMSDHLLGSYKWRGRERLSNKSLVGEVSSMRSFWGWCLTTYDLPYKPFLIKVKLDHGQRRAEFPGDKITELVAFCDDRAFAGDTRGHHSWLSLRGLILLISQVGFRPGECRGMRFSDIKVMSDYVLFSVSGKRGEGVAVAPLSIMKVIADLRALHSGEYVFSTCFGEKSETLYYNLFRKGVVFIGLGSADPVVSLYSLRHYHISDQLREGLSIYDIALGHRTSVDMITTAYSHVVVSDRWRSLIGHAKRGVSGGNNSSV